MFTSFCSTLYAASLYASTSTCGPLKPTTQSIYISGWMSAPCSVELTALNVRIYRHQLQVVCTNVMHLVNRECLLARGEGEDGLLNLPLAEYNRQTKVQIHIGVFISNM